MRDLGKSFGFHAVLQSISLDIARGEFITILGESGSGKTTLLRIIAGFEQASSGDVLLDGRSLLSIPAHRRPVNTVFQNYALFPHLSLFDNVAYGLRAQGVEKAEIQERVGESLELVRMDAFAARFPGQISGGQKQRVALARALVNRPQALLLDEPLSALDANLRSDVQRELKLLQQQLGITFLFVTHDQEEAMAMSDRIVLLHQGRIAQCATPETIYSRPRSSYVARFIGKSNVLTAETLRRIAGSEYVTEPDALGKTLFSLRPEAIRMAGEDSTSDQVRFAAMVEVQQFHGSSLLVSLRCLEGTVLSARLFGPHTLIAGKSYEFMVRVADLVRLEDSGDTA